MIRFFSKLRNNNKGFTLVELMVVVVIIGILVAIAVPIYNSTTGTAKLNAHMSNIRIIEAAIEQYKINNSGTAPTDLDALKKYVVDWPTKPGEYKINTGGELEANPTKAATQAAIADSSKTVEWPK